MAWVHNNVILPLLESERHQGLGRRLRELDRFERASHADQRAMQAASLKRLIEHAYDATPYYRRLFDEAGFHPSEWKPGERLPLPVLTRDLLRTHEEDLRSRRHSVDELHAAATGGTTSTPVRLWRDTEALRKKTALQCHLNRMVGYDQGDSILMIWGAERDLELNPSWRWRLYEEGVMRRYAAAAGQISDEIFARFFARLNQQRPKVLYGYSVTLARFAEYVLINKLKAHQPKVIITTAEAVSEVERDFIQRAFGSKPTDHYGSRDVGMIGSECESHTGLHFHPAGCFVEFEYAGVTPDGPMHKLIITDLLNYGMPMIRYSTGDCVIVDEQACACGNWYPKVKKLLGRSNDNLLLPDGTEVPGITFGTRMATMKETLNCVRQVQIVQKNTQSLIVRYAAQGDERSIEEELKRLCVLFHDIMKTPVRVNFVRLAEIPREQSGKLRLCISEVKRDANAMS
jgi:phenylacetate-CoA ligase